VRSIGLASVAELDLPADYRDLLVEFVDRGVEFVLVGGWAVAVHGHGRATDDMDVFIKASPENARRTYQALLAFGAPVAAHGITEGLFCQEGYGYRLGRPSSSRSSPRSTGSRSTKRRRIRPASKSGAARSR
jgi:hypothetical protein